MRVFFGFLVLMAAAFPAWCGEFSLTSPDIADGQALGQEQVLQGFGCSGGNVSPALRWNNAPTGTKSFAVTVYDPDAPTGSGWWHWVVFNIPASVAELMTDAGSGHALPAGAVQSRTDFGTSGYGGACPPPGAPHRYMFTVHALDVERIDLTPDSPAAMVGFHLGQHTLGTASITAVYGR
jgi:Raf kinase inhibitor-like YbhB/YbcL family protein